MKNKLYKLYDQIYHDESTKDPKKFIEIIENEISIFDDDFSDNHDDYIKITR